MGVYSSYRPATKLATESIEFDTPDYSASSIMETVISIHETEHKVFESLLELDMMELYLKEEGGSETESEPKNEEKKEAATEAKKKKLSEVISGAIQKAITAVTTAISNFIDKLSMVINQNKKIKDTYIPFIVKSEYLKDYTLPVDMKVKNDNSVEMKGMASVKSISDNYLKAIKSAKTVEEIGTSKENCINKLNEIVDSEFKNTQAFKIYPAGTKFSASEIQKFGERMDLAKTKAIKNIKAEGNKVIAELKNQKKNFEGAMRELHQEEKDIVEAGTEAAFKIISATIRAYLKLQQFDIEQFRIDFKSARNIILTAYNFCAKAEKKDNKENKDNEAKTESASLLESVVMESSDSYIDAIFE